MEIVSVDLARIADPVLMALTPFLAIALLLMKHIGSPDLSRRIPAWNDVVDRLVQAGSIRRAAVLLLTYLLKAARDQDAPRALQELIPVPEEVYMTLAEKLRREGLQEGLGQGLEQGLQQGLQQGERHERMLALLDVLARFGPVDDGTKARLESADIETLRRWFSRALNSTRVEDVFAGE